QDEEGTATQWLAAIVAWLLPFLPSPGNIALANLTRVAAGPDVPRFSDFREALSVHWRLGVQSTLISVAVTLALAWNVWFYASVGNGWLRLVSIVWLYGTLFWLSLHLYFVSLAVHVPRPRLFNLYRRAAFVALGHPL